MTKLSRATRKLLDEVRDGMYQRTGEYIHDDGIIYGCLRFFLELPDTSEVYDRIGRPKLPESG